MDNEPAQFRPIAAYLECEMSDWISVKDRLPENRELILAVSDENEIAVCRFDKTEWEYFFMLYNTCYQLRKVTHWCKLPEPPR